MTDLTNLIKTDIEHGQTTREIHLSGGLIYRYASRGLDEKIIIYRVYPEEASISEANTFINHARQALKALRGGQWIVKRSTKQDATIGKGKNKRRLVGYSITWQREVHAAEQEPLI